MFRRSLIIFLLFAAQPLVAQNFMIYGATRLDGAGACTGAGGTDPLAAAYRNPGFILPPRPVLEFGGFAVVDSPKINGINHRDWSGVAEVAFASPLPVFGLKDRLFIGLTLQAPGTTIYRIRAMPVTRPQYLFLRSSVRRLNLALALSVRILKNLSIGAGFTVLPQVDGKVAVDFTNSGQVSYTQVDVKLRFAPVVGIAYRPLKWLGIGLVYRGGNHTPINIPVTVKVSDQIPDIYASVNAQELYAPRMVSGGLSFTVGKFVLAADVNYLFYSDLVQPSPAVYLKDSSGKVTKAAIPPSPGPHNVFNPSFALTYRPLPWLRLKTGYAFMPSVLHEQSGQTNLLDSPKHTVSLGVGLDLDSLSNLPMGLALSAAYTFYPGQTDEKAKPLVTNEGYPSITYSGMSGNLGMDVWIRF